MRHVILWNEVELRRKRVSLAPPAEYRPRTRPEPSSSEGEAEMFSQVSDIHGTRRTVHRVVAVLGPGGRVRSSPLMTGMPSPQSGSVFSLLQKNVLDRQTWQSREELRIAIVTWIERTYHRRRRQRVVGRLTPVEFEILEIELQAA